MLVIPEHLMQHFTKTLEFAENQYLDHILILSSFFFTSNVLFQYLLSIYYARYCDVLSELIDLKICI